MERDVVYVSPAKPLSDNEPLGATEKLTWRDFIKVTKPGIVRSNVLSTVIGFWLAAQSVTDGAPTVAGMSAFWLFLYTFIGTTLVIASGCVLNNMLDRDLDQLMERTRNRPSVTKMSQKTLFIYGVVLGLTGLIILTVFVNGLTAFLGLIGWFYYVIVYTAWLKRTSSLNTVVGGISGAVPPVMGWCAVTGQLDVSAWFLFVFIFLWQPPHFLALAMRRSEEYDRAGFKMLPSESGYAETKWQILLWVAAMLPASIVLFLIPALGYIYLTTAVVFGGIYLYYAIQGVWKRGLDDKRWAGKMFGFSLVYLIVMFTAMFVDAALY